MSSVKVKLHFMLVGKSDSWKRQIPKSHVVDWTNFDTFSSIRDTVVDHFGNRALYIPNEEVLQSPNTSYPPFYSAGWFISDDENPSELVVVGHGRTMKDANNNTMELLKLHWNEQSVAIK